MITIPVKGRHVAEAYVWCAQKLGNPAVSPITDQFKTTNVMCRKRYLDFNLEQPGWHLADNVFYFRDEEWATAFKLVWA